MSINSANLNFTSINKYTDFDTFKKTITEDPTINLKTDGNLSLVYFTDNSENKLIDKSIIVENDSMKPLVSLFSKILYNKDAESFLKDKDWSKIVAEKCYEGTVLTVYYSNNKWYVSTRRCLNASDSSWVKNFSYKEMFDEAMENKFDYDELNKDYCYYFVLIHYKNRNLINYSNLGYDVMYKDIIHIQTTKKYSQEEVDYTINTKIKKSEQVYFSNLSELLDDLEEISKDNKLKKVLTTEGYILKYYEGEIKNSDFTVCKLQTDIYQEIAKVKPNNSNLHVAYLELYQKDILTDYLPYFSKYNTDIVRRINNSMRSVAQEILDIYHGTRQQNNPDIYKNLKEQYKKTLYDLHGIFIGYRKPKYINEKEKYIGNRSITVHDVYHYLKNKTPSQLKQIYFERMSMLESPIFDKFLNKDCLDTSTLTTLMFQNSYKKPKKEKIDIILA
uniref:RNA ligase n=1 Tax=viral metagenome TaxID=1070528 RepID=A0A6C0ABW5_9ZZZZ